MSDAQATQGHHDRVPRPIAAQLARELNLGAATAGLSRYFDGQAARADLAVGLVRVGRQPDHDDHSAVSVDSSPSPSARPRWAAPRG